MFRVITNHASKIRKAIQIPFFHVKKLLIRGKKYQERLGGAQLLQIFEFPNVFPTGKSTGNSNYCKYHAS